MAEPIISIVDDDELFRSATEMLIRSLGLTPRAFSSADCYLKSAWVEKTHCLIVDVQMPNMSGLALQEHLVERGLDVPIIFMTASPEEADRTKAMNSGALCFLHKSVGLEGQFIDRWLSVALSKKAAL